MGTPTGAGGYRGLRLRAKSGNFRVRFEALEKRLLLSLNANPGTMDTPANDEADARQAAIVDFNGPSLVGKNGPMVKIGFDLDLLYEEQKIHDAREPGTAFQPSNSLLVVSDGQVLVDVVPTGDRAAFESQLTALGMKVTATADSIIEGSVPISALNQLAGLSGLNFAIPSYTPITRTGSVESQGDVALKANLARAAFGVDGSGLTVGILSDSFDSVQYPGGVDGVKQDIATNDLPQQTKILQDSPNRTDEGRAMGQIVHDVAPGAAIDFATAEGGQVNFAANIQNLVAAGSNIVVDDVGYFTEPFFQDGVIAQAVSTVVAAGIPYFSAAGNDGTASYQAGFVNSGVTGPGGGKLHDFDPGPGVSTLQQINIPVGASFLPSFQWDQPFGSLGGSGSASDLDIYLLGADKKTVVASSVVKNIGGDPLEIFRFINNSPDTTFYFEIELVSGPAPGLMKYVDNGQGARIATFATNSSTDVGHPNAAGAVGVAAAAYFFTPAYGQSPPVLNSFSSEGGTPILFDPTGNRLPAAINRGSPQVTGVDGVNTTFFGEVLTQGHPSLPSFFGTSAAGPHVAAVAALILQAAGGSGSLTPQNVYTDLENSGIDIVNREDAFSRGTLIPIANGVGVDNFSGHGLVDAFEAVQAVASRVAIGPDVTMLEGNSGFTDFVFTVTLSGVIAKPVTVSYATLDGTATAPGDYTAQSNTLTFQPGGPKTLTITIQVVGDTAVEEPNETFFVDLTKVTNSILGRAQAVGNIVNDDNDISINDVTVVQPRSDTTNAVFTISSFGVVPQPISVNWTTVDGTATSFSDYLPQSGTVTFPPSGGTATITVPIVADLQFELPESFDVVLSNAVSGQIVKSFGVCTILNPNLQPALYVNDIQVKSTQSGVVNAVFTVALDTASGDFTTVQFATEDGGARAGTNYTPTSGTLTFAPGVTSEFVTVPVMTSATYAPNEQFYLDLSNPVHAKLATPRGTATIVFATAPSGETIVDDGDPNFSETAGWVTLTNTAAYQLDFAYHTPGDGSGAATWSFPDLATGTYQVFAHWVPFMNRATNAPFTILDGSTSLGTVSVNEQLAPAGDLSNGITWQSLGTFTTSNGMLAVRLNDSANGYVIADAIRVVAGGIAATAPQMNASGGGLSIPDRIIAGTLAGPSFDNATDFGDVAATTNSATHTFTITNTGDADLHLTGAPRVTISGVDAQDFTVLTQPASTIGPGATSTFQVIFHPSDVGLRQAVISIANDDANKSPYTFDVQGNGTTAGPLQLLLDDSMVGYTQTGAWVTSANSHAVQGEMRSDGGGAGNDHAIWSFSGLAPGNYTVYATWVPFINRATNAPFTIADGSATQTTVSVNQQQEPSGLAAAGTMWTSLASLQLSTGALTVTLSNQANGFVIADAVYLVRNDPPAAPIVVTSDPPSNPPTSNFAHNSALPQDVNGDGHVSSLDALLVIDHLLNAGITNNAATNATAQAVTSNSYLDVNGDGIVSPLDALLVIDYLDNQTSQTNAVSAAVASPSVSAAVPASSAANAPATSSAVSSQAALGAAAVDQAIGQLSGTQPSAAGPVDAGPPPFPVSGPVSAGQPSATSPTVAATGLLTPATVRTFFDASDQTSGGTSVVDPLDD